jgi:HJR/Mrr/RecB family endonuclease
MNPDKRIWGARLQRLSPRVFKRLTATIFEVHGWRCGASTPGPDGGIDITARRSGIIELTAAVQVKQYDLDCSIGVGIIREYAGLYRAADPPDTVCLVASSEFTTTAYAEANERDV